MIIMKFKIKVQIGDDGRWIENVLQKLFENKYIYHVKFRLSNIADFESQRYKKCSWDSFHWFIFNYSDCRRVFNIVTHNNADICLCSDSNGPNRMMFHKIAEFVELKSVEEFLSLNILKNDPPYSIPSDKNESEVPSLPTAESDDALYNEYYSMVNQNYYHYTNTR